MFIQEDGTLILGEKSLNAESVNSFDVVVEAIDRSGNKVGEPQKDLWTTSATD